MQSFELTAMKRFFEAKTTLDLILVRCPEDQKPNWGSRNPELGGLLYDRANREIVPAWDSWVGSNEVGRSLPV